MALCIYSLLMLLLITTRWKWNLGCFRAAVRTDSMRWKRISGNTTEASFCFNFRGHTGLQFPGGRRNCCQRKARWKHTLKVCLSNPQRQMSFRGITVIPLNHKSLPFEGIIWGTQVSFFTGFLKTTRSLSTDHSQGCSTLANSLPVSPTASIHLSISLPHQACPQVTQNSTLVIFCLAHGLTGRFPAWRHHPLHGDHVEITLPLLRSSDSSVG